MRKEQLRAVVRVDSGNRIGMGHVAECLSLCKTISGSARAEFLFLTRNFKPGIDRIRKSGYPIRIINGSNSVGRDTGWLIRAASDFKADIIIVDLLRVRRADPGAVIIDNSYFKSTNSAGLPAVAVFDDDVHQETDASAVINFHICQRQSYYKRFKDKDKYLTGPKYALLDDVYYRIWKKKKNISKACGNLFINQGGSDPYNLTYKILRAMKDLEIHARVNVVIGSGIEKKHLSCINSIKVSLGRQFRCFFGIKPPQMRKLMMKADLAVSAAGNTLYELCALGVPTAVLSHHKDHDIVAKGFEKLGAVVNIGIGTEVSVSFISSRINDIYKDHKRRICLSTMARNVTDGAGCIRAAEHILCLAGKS